MSLRCFLSPPLFCCCCVVAVPQTLRQTLHQTLKQTLKQVWDPVTGKLKKDLTYQAEEMFMMHEEAVLALAFNRESSVLVSGTLRGNSTAALVQRCSRRTRVCCCCWPLPNTCWRWADSGQHGAGGTACWLAPHIAVCVCVACMCLSTVSDGLLMSPQARRCVCTRPCCCSGFLP